MFNATKKELLDLDNCPVVAFTIRVVLIFPFDCLKTKFAPKNKKKHDDAKY